MARGWESKSVSDQIEEREAGKSASPAIIRSPEEIRRSQKREGLRLARLSAAEALERATHPRRRAMLERALSDLDAEMATLERIDS